MLSQPKTTYSLAALCALLAVALVWSLANSHSAQLNAQNRIAGLERQLNTVPKPPASVAPPAPVTIVRTVVEPAAPSTLTTANLAKLNDDLAAARTRISELESKVLSLDADRATLAQQRQQELTANEERFRTRLAEAEHAVQTMQADLKAARDRATLFESENENLRKAAAAKLPERAAAAPVQLDEISRRRETYLKSLIRRYREIDNDYRSLVRDSQGAHSTDPALLRIQATLSQAEEDLRQIDSLDAKSLLVEKRH